MTNVKPSNGHALSLPKKRALTPNEIHNLSLAHFVGKHRFFPETVVKIGERVYRKSSGCVVFDFASSEMIVRTLKEIQTKLEEE